MLIPFVELFNTVINLLNFILFAWIILSWLISFDIVNRNQPVVYKLNYAMTKLLDPLLNPIRRVLPDLGGIDISPIILIILLRFFQSMVLHLSLGM